MPLIRPYYLTILASLVFVLLFNAFRQFADGIIFNNKDVDGELRQFAQGLKKPTLDYPGDDTYIDAYSDFFDKIIG